MTMGVGLIGTLAGFIANKLLAPDPTENNEQDMTDTGTNISQIRNTLHEQNQQNEQIQQRLDRIEQQFKRRPPEGT